MIADALLSTYQNGADKLKKDHVARLERILPTLVGMKKEKGVSLILGEHQKLSEK